jgi:hypothetical protein
MENLETLGHSRPGIIVVVEILTSHETFDCLLDTHGRRGWVADWEDIRGMRLLFKRVKDYRTQSTPEYIVAIRFGSERNDILTPFIQST